MIRWSNILKTFDKKHHISRNKLGSYDWHYLVGLGQLESTALKTLVGYTQLFWRINKYLSNDSQNIEIDAAAH